MDKGNQLSTDLLKVLTLELKNEVASVLSKEGDEDYGVVLDRVHNMCGDDVVDLINEISARKVRSNYFDKLYDLREKVLNTDFNSNQSVKLLKKEFESHTFDTTPREGIVKAFRHYGINIRL